MFLCYIQPLIEKYRVAAELPPLRNRMGSQQ